jgi:hypothetical protein
MVKALLKKLGRVAPLIGVGVVALKLKRRRDASGESA